MPMDDLMSNRSGLILAASDLSDAADEAICQPDARACTTGSKLVVRAVVPDIVSVDPMMPTTSPPIDMRALRANVEEELRARVVRLTKRERSDVDVRVLSGVPYAAIVEEAGRLGARLVVVGNRGRTGLAATLLGSVAARVVRYAHCPVLVARPRPLTGKVLVATDFSDPALPAIRAAAEETSRIGGKITAVHCLDAPSPDWLGLIHGATVEGLAISEASSRVARDRARDRLAAALGQAGIAGEMFVVSGSPADVIVDVAREVQAEVIVVGTAGRTGLRRVVLGSVAERVVRHAPTSVLVVRLAV
jgi:nucleotide-binding universal stress UspA family protein